MLGEQARQLRIRRAAPVEVGADREHDRPPGPRRATSSAMNAARSSSSWQAVNVSSNWSTTSTTSAVRAAAVAVASSPSGCAPGRISDLRPRLAGGQHAGGERGSRPARTTEDFPLPEGPTTPSSGAPTSRATSSATSRSRPKKYGASATSKDGEPLERDIARARRRRPQLDALVARLQLDTRRRARPPSTRSPRGRPRCARPPRSTRRAASRRAHRPASSWTRRGTPPAARSTRAGRRRGAASARAASASSGPSARASPRRRRKASASRPEAMTSDGQARHDRRERAERGRQLVGAAVGVVDHQQRRPASPR